MKILRVTFSPIAQIHMKYWAENDLKIYEKIFRLIESAAIDPDSGIGKPEKLSMNMKGFWSRRISRQHRLVYTIKGKELFIIQARFHYED